MTVVAHFVGASGAAMDPTATTSGQVFVWDGAGSRWPLSPRPDGALTCTVDAPAVAGRSWQLLVFLYQYGTPTFAATYVDFTAGAGLVDLGTIDLGTHGLSMVSPAKDAVETSYPIDFVWTPYDRPDVTASDYSPSIGAVHMDGGYYTPRTSETHFVLPARTRSMSGKGYWSVSVSYRTPSGQRVTQETYGTGLTFPD
jgi:hypothetical protein